MKRNIRIGLVGLGFPNFKARSNRVLEKAAEDLRGVVESLHEELIVYPSLIENPEESKKAARFIEEKNVDFLIVQAASFSLGDNLYPLFSVVKRMGFWCVPEPTYEGELQLNSLTGFNLAVSLVHMYAPEVDVKWFFGSPGNPTFDEPFSITVKALRGVVHIPGSKIGQIGPIVPTFDNLAYDKNMLNKNLGVEVINIDVKELIELGKQLDRVEIDRIVGNLKEQASRVLVKDIWLEKTAGIIGALEILKERYKLDAAAVRCWPEFQEELNIAPCAALAYANNCGFSTGCEGDLLGTLSMLVSFYIQGTPPTMNDPVAFDEKTDTIQMWHCGPGPVFWADREGQTLDYHHTLNRLKKDGEPPSGVSADISFKEGEVTILRLDNTGTKLFVCEAEVVKGPSRPFPGSGGWLGKLSVDLKSFTVKDFLQTMVTYGIEHHYPMCDGHIEDILREMSAWMKIEVLPFKTWKPYKQGI